MASAVRPARRRLEAISSPGQLQALTDDLLEEIFLRIGSPADLVRASAARSCFRRIITDPAFLSRYRSLHPLQLLGFLEGELDGSLSPAPPVSEGTRWRLRDVREGRVLFECSSLVHYDYDNFASIPNLAVCDPLTRRYLLLPRIPDDLLASVQLQDIFEFETLLVPTRDNQSSTSFKVMRKIVCRTKMVIFVFSSGPGRWNAVKSISWDALNVRLQGQMLQYAYGCFYWKIDRMNKLLKLDINRMEFSTDDLPPDHARRNIVIAEAAEGRLGMFSLIHGGTSVHYSTSVRNEDKRNSEWQMESIIPLPHNYDNYYFKETGIE
ncbi:hypothetical protein EJB05_11929, partial [Eragrostis curvula]